MAFWEAPVERPLFDEQRFVLRGPHVTTIQLNQSVYNFSIDQHVTVQQQMVKTGLWKSLSAFRTVTYDQVDQAYNTEDGNVRRSFGALQGCRCRARSC